MQPAHRLGRDRQTDGGVICALLLAGTGALIFFTGSGPMFWLVPAIYLAINTAYSMGLKNVPIVDVAILAAGYLLRVLYGSVSSRGFRSPAGCI